MALKDFGRFGPGQAVEVSEDVYAYVQHDGSWWINNTGFMVGSRGVVSIDACSTEARTRAYLETMAEFSDQPVRTLINTHHGDHTFGNYLPGLGDVSGIVVCSRGLVAGNDVGRLACGDVVQRLPPFLAGRAVGVDGEAEHSVVDDVACYHEVEIRNVHEGRVGSVGVAGPMHEQAVAFEIDVVALERLRRDDLIRDLLAEERTPQAVVDLGRRLLAHPVDNLGKRNHLHIGVERHEGAEAEEMVTMAVCHVDRLESESTTGDPVDECGCMLLGGQSVDEDGVLLTADEGR